jgi:chromosome segregation ATPase
MTHPTHGGDGQAVFDDEFTLLDDLIRSGSNPEFEHLKSVIADAEFERAQAEARAKTAEGKAQRLAAQLEQTTAERDGALRQLAEANAREGEMSRTISGLRFELGEAAGARDALRAVLEHMVAAVMTGAPDPLADAPDPLAGALDALEAAGLPTLPSSSRLAVAA